KPERRQELYRYRRLKADARSSSVGQALVELLGDKLVNYRVQRNSDIGTLAQIEAASAFDTQYSALMVPPSIPIQIGRIRRGLTDTTSARKLFEIDWI